MGICVLYASRSPSLIYQMPQLFSNFTVNFWKFFTFAVEGKMSLYFTVTFLLTPFSIFTFSQIVAICQNLNDSFSGHRCLLRTVWCLNTMVCKPHFSFISFPQPLIHQRLINSHRAITFSPLWASTQWCAWMWMEVWASLSLAVWTWKYLVVRGSSKDVAPKNQPEAGGLSGKKAIQRQTEETSFLFFNLFLRESVYLMAQKVVWLPRQAA